MIFGYMQVSLMIALIILITFLLVIIYSRFGIKKYNKWKWLFLYLSIILVSITSSIFQYPEIWKKVIIDLQLISLATIFSGIAAFVVVAQLSNKTAVYTKVDNTKIDKVKTVLLEANQSNTIDFKIVNVSKVTANDIVIQCTFPKSIKVQSIGVPTWGSTINNDHGFEIHLDTDRSYNPIHPRMSKSFSVTLNCKEIEGAEPVAITTNAKDINWNPHVFMVSTSKDFIETKAYKKFIKKNITVFNIVKKYFTLLKYMTIVIGVLGVIPFIYSLF